MYVKGRLFICRKSGAVLGSTLAKLSFTIIDHAFNSKIPRFGFSFEIGPEKVLIRSLGTGFHWKLVRKRSGFALKSGPDLVLFWKILVLFKIWVHC